MDLGPHVERLREVSDPHRPGHIYEVGTNLSRSTDGGATWANTNWESKGVHVDHHALEFDPVNSFHLHGNFYHYSPTGTALEPAEFTDTVMQCQGQRGILELRFPGTGKFMFHAHQSEFTELGWQGFFEVGT